MQAPEKVTALFVQALADGDCDKGSEYATGPAKTKVLASKEYGCEAYQTEIITIDCTVKGDSAWCQCNETRPQNKDNLFYNITFNHDLVLVEGEWKVCDFRWQIPDSLKY